MLLLLVIAQASPPPEPSPHGWATTGEKLVTLAHTQPDAFWPILACALPLLTVAGVVLLVVRWLLPAWREEKKADRDALVTALRQRGEEAERDATKDREVARAQNDAIVSRIEQKIDRQAGELQRVGERVERHSEVLARLAAKVGVGLALLCAFCGGLAAGAGAFALAERPAVYAPAQPAQQQPVQTQTAADDDTARGECVRKPCAANQRCCGPERCCEVKTGTAKEPAALAPLSALAFSDLDCAAYDTCDPSVDRCD